MNIRYVAKPADHHGFISYSPEENAVWEFLIKRQNEILKHRACDEFLHGVNLLDLPANRVPQYPEVNLKLKKPNAKSN